MNHHLIKCIILHSLEKLNSKELYLIQVTHDFCKPTSQIYFEKHFKDCILDWKYIYILPCIVTSDPFTHYFQDKVLNNGLYLNEKLFSFDISETSQCSFCNQNKETIEYHCFCHCFVAKALWNGGNTFLKIYFIDCIIQNHLLLVFKIYLYKSLSYEFVCLKSLLLEIKKINCLAKKIAEANTNKS